MKEPQFDEAQSRLTPTRIESNQAGITNKFKRADRAVGRLKPKNDDHALAQPAEPGMDRKPGLVRVNRIVEQHVEHRLIPKNLCIAREPRSRNMRQCLIV